MGVNKQACNANCKNYKNNKTCANPEVLPYIPKKLPPVHLHKELRQHSFQFLHLVSSQLHH